MAHCYNLILRLRELRVGGWLDVATVLVFLLFDARVYAFFEVPKSLARRLLESEWSCRWLEWYLFWITVDWRDVRKLKLINVLLRTLSQDRHSSNLAFNSLPLGS